jgi:hypothetical protein
MSRDTELAQETNRIADAIVKLVERSRGGVTLFKLDREIPGFATEDPDSWDCYSELGGNQQIYWDGMTEVGTLALQQVLFGNKVAVEFTTPLIYLLLEGRYLNCENWCPVLLYPAKAANVRTPQGLLYLPKQFLKPEMMRPRWERITPAPPYTAPPLPPG